MAIAIELTEFDATPTLEIRTRTPVAGLPALIGRNYGLLSAYLAELGVKRAGVPFTSYHNTDMANLDVSMGFAVPRDVPGGAKSWPVPSPADRPRSASTSAPTPRCRRHTRSYSPGSACTATSPPARSTSSI